MSSLWVSAVISLAISLPLVTWIFYGTINPSLDEALRTSARFNAQEIAGIMNILQASPDGTEHNFALPSLECRVKIDSRVTVTIQQKYTHVTDYLHSPVPVQGNEFECDKKKERTLTFSRAGGRITVRG